MKPPCLVVRGAVDRSGAEEYVVLGRDSLRERIDNTPTIKGNYYGDSAESIVLAGIMKSKQFFATLVGTGNR